MVGKHILQFRPRVNRFGRKVSVPYHGTFPESHRKDLAFDRPLYHMVVHDNFDIQDVFVRAGGSVIGIQRRRFLHSSREASFSDLLGKWTAEVFFIAAHERLRMSSPVAIVTPRRASGTLFSMGSF